MIAMQSISKMYLYIIIFSLKSLMGEELESFLGLLLLLVFSDDSYSKARLSLFASAALLATSKALVKGQKQDLLK